MTSEVMTSLVQSLLHGLTTGSDVPAEPLDKYKAIEMFHQYKDGTDMREFIQALEIEFDQARVDPREYKRILISKLSPKTKDICIDLITDSWVGYMSLKGRLLEKSGMSLREVETCLFVSWGGETKDMDRKDRCRLLKGLFDRFLLGLTTADQVRNRLLFALHYSIGLTKS